MDLKETAILGDLIDDHWYYKSKSKALIKLISTYSCTSILDVGAGSGFFSEKLLQIKTIGNACCVDTSYDKNSDSFVNSKPIKFRKEIQNVEADLILFMDVLEHVDDDIALLKSYVDKAPDNAVFVISVPAFMFLWSDHDIFLEHKRRYTLPQLEHVAETANLNVMRSCYYFSLVFPIATIIRLVSKFIRPKKHTPRSDLKRHGPLINSLLSIASKLELNFFKWNKLLGLTVFCIAQKKHGA